MALVSFSRQEGSLGGQMARDVGVRLGYRLLDLDGLLQEAEAYGGLKSTASELYEKQPGLLERLDRERRRYQTILRAVTYKVARQDNVVFLGRGTGMLVKELSHGYQVLVVAPFATRVERIMQTGTSSRPGQKSREEAEEIIRRADRERGGYIRYLFNLDWLDPRQYDLVLNTGSISPETGVDMVVKALEKLQLKPDQATLARLDEMASTCHQEAEKMRRG